MLVSLLSYVLILNQFCTRTERIIQSISDISRDYWSYKFLFIHGTWRLLFWRKWKIYSSLLICRFVRIMIVIFTLSKSKSSLNKLILNKNKNHSNQNYIKSKSRFWLSKSWFNFKNHAHYCRTDIDKAMVISALRHKSKFNLDLFWKENQILGFHVVVLDDFSIDVRLILTKIGWFLLSG